MKLLSHYIKNQTNRFSEIINWKSHNINDMLYYSYRDTVYNKNTYPSNLHYHDYYELVIFEGGDIKYICESTIYSPKCGDVILIPPGKFHMSIINGESTRYRRHVFYLFPSAFEKIGNGALTEFLKKADEGYLFSFSSPKEKRFLNELTESLREIFDGNPSSLESALGLSRVINLFYLFNLECFGLKNESTLLPDNVLLLQRYIDENYSKISSVTELAEKLSYSREYISRLFKKYFDTTVSDYIMKRRIAESQLLLTKDYPIIDIAYQVGFGSLSSFIRSFRCVTNMTPSEYRKLSQKQFGS